ncbi:30S ribosomal protein S11 [Candidatus Campbellbacteria bacterium CG22_combo_CG10-13_8_21_14_all_36_13]|uniref:Small ribosomal subunit protein uS11 n=1 Tax=Candidatus Campbellbacteria bacterium CG22_combo_CG10-13_8_21_14_all_36_13 TaxID=1974529 RepID=A0A2H0DZ48_9BACT|nr:MAG: 30S ribosomal protein S11 [Candidatus Campbellbacteria bacterium CG22_combo_CG10-13_8_21_14_all_36_13]
MGKKRIVKQGGGQMDSGAKARALAKAPTKKVEKGALYIESTYNNTRVTLADIKGNVIAWSSSGALGFKGAKKGTPFAAAKVGEIVGDKAKMSGVKSVAVTIKGVGAGRESALRAFVSKGISVLIIKDVTPVPHNGPKPPKPRRV